MSRILFLTRQLMSRLWFSASVYGAVAVGLALLPLALGDVLPDALLWDFGADSVETVLTILASSMLSVTIFSLSTMVAAYASVTGNVTPRATALLLEDKLSHRALATFLGTFIFGIVALVALKAGFYDEDARSVLFTATIGVVALIVVTLLRWIEYLTRLGRMNETIGRVECSAREALQTRQQAPFLDAQPLLDDGEIPEDCALVEAGRTGYVQHIDMPALSGLAEEHGVEVQVRALPGKLVDPHTPLVSVRGETGEDLTGRLVECFVIGNERSFRQDPRFGLVVLSEIASRALSSAVNDPGTAIQVIGTVVRLLTEWAQECRPESECEVKYPRVFVPPLPVAELAEDAFAPIERGAASLLEVQLRLQKAYAALARSENPGLVAAAEERSRRALRWSEQGLVLEEDLERVRGAAERVGGP